MVSASGQEGVPGVSARKGRPRQREYVVHAAVFSDGTTLSSTNKTRLVTAANSRLWEHQVVTDLHYRLEERVMRDE